jgi:hypothetical protein
VLVAPSGEALLEHAGNVDASRARALGPGEHAVRTMLASSAADLTRPPNARYLACGREDAVMASGE